MAAHDPAPGVFTCVDDLLRLRHLAQNLTLQARKQSRALTGGGARTRYRGRGMEFAEVRPYQPGDDIRTIDWRVTARVQEPYTKLFQEEHERPVFVLVDLRSNMFFGSKRLFKSVYAAELAALIAWIANRSNERVGALIFGDLQQKNIRARRGKHAVLEMLNELGSGSQALSSPIKPATAFTLEAMLTEASRVARPGSLVILLSDFHDFDDACAKPLRQIARRSDVLALHLYDQLEQALPSNQVLTLSDRINRLTLRTGPIAERFAQSFSRQQQYLKDQTAVCGVTYVDTPITTPLDDFARDLFTARTGRSRQIASASSRGTAA